ncbi:competence/damage-inducible protein CinA [Chitinivibrio alkaliphilus ACht1]|uniref:Competence/damage-inducible protein CinA n=1 Tax=Chitinivibrio alkaliphilus ACht1 TaxID=1313304 RepID=U7DA29_9BACT|nr:competence/damage-inducible protein CinA [Chitinivibrio alkaliphilus ACht1]
MHEDRDRLIAVCDCHGESIGVAESCTGGLLGELLTEKAGASAWFRGGVIAYDNDVKEQLLSVPSHILARHGAVSRETAMFMASGVQRLLSVRCSMAVSGVAGPGGAVAGKPVGTVCIAAATMNQIVSRSYYFYGNRRRVRLCAAREAFRLLLFLLPSPR